MNQSDSGKSFEAAVMQELPLDIVFLLPHVRVRAAKIPALQAQKLPRFYAVLSSAKSGLRPVSMRTNTHMRSSVSFRQAMPIFFLSVSFVALPLNEYIQFSVNFRMQFLQEQAVFGNFCFGCGHLRVVD